MKIIAQIVIIFLIAWVILLIVLDISHAETIEIKYTISSPYLTTGSVTPTPKGVLKKTKDTPSTASSGGIKTPVKNPVVMPPQGDVQQKVYEATVKKFGAEHWEAMKFIISHESGFRLNAVNASSGACGLGQALPCSKMGCESLEDIDCQVKWLMGYIKSRYGNPQMAYEFWIKNSWY